MEIKRLNRKSDGKTFRIYDDLPLLGHWYSIEYLEQMNEHFHVWYPLYDTPKRIPTIEEAETLLNEICDN